MPTTPPETAPISGATTDSRRSIFGGLYGSGCESWAIGDSSCRVSRRDATSEPPARQRPRRPRPHRAARRVLVTRPVPRGRSRGGESRAGGLEPSTFRDHTDRVARSERALPSLWGPTGDG